MDNSYRDHIVLVTGGNSGIGRAFVARFVAAGAKVMTVIDSTPVAIRIRRR